MNLSIIHNALQILLQRPFLGSGHLSKASEDGDRVAGEQACIDAALAIWHLVESYKTAFTLRRAPYIISYSVYSATVAILNQTLFERSRFTQCMSFFWSALTDLRRGSNSGLQKPLDILRDMMTKFGEDIPRPTTQDGLASLDFMALEKVGHVMGDDLANQPAGLAEDENQWINNDSQQWGPLGGWEAGNYSGTDDDWPLNDTLYGLFMPDQSKY